ncbi:dihydrolipoyl dehydrogenase [Streptomyces griseoruber]|uniref:Dihydrolipoyl dehydrogenase n=1 Tax=Streptomyces griseoruber TaxID=1943 RepID=A0A101SKW1_9ACTN|nr:dihydrolipoyl dehydrogenase [Streptomyces griseoruber]KUN76074.1 dihydrolipoamide dehydrogenase [Streptomyces griseoruber]
MLDGAQNIYDLVILGGGSGGYAAALRAADLGLSVALIEKAEVGGTCLHRGCIPTKALLHAGAVADSAREAAKFGVRSTFAGIDMPGVSAYKDRVVGQLYRGLQSTLKARGVQVVAGEGHLRSPHEVAVGQAVVRGRHILLATGSAPASLPGLVIDGDRILSSEQALRLDHVPGSAVVLGGGVIGCEFASLWKSLGAEVTIVEALPHLVPTEDEDSSKLLERAFRRRGIAFHLNSRFAEAARTASGVRVTTESGTSIDAELLLVAVGRRPVSAGLGYEAAGVELDRGYVKVDEYCRSSVPSVSAVGDLIPTPQLAHVGFAEGILVAERLAGLDPVPIDYDGVPRVTFSHPEVASVGLTEAHAKERYGTDQVVTLRQSLVSNGKSKILTAPGEIKLVRRKDGPVLGVHLVGDRAGELIGEAQLIVNWDALPDEVAHLIHAHPTQTEILGEAHLALTGKPLHAHD